MGMLLSVPMIIAGAIIIVVAWRRKMPKQVPNRSKGRRDRVFAAPVRDQEADHIAGPMPVWRYMELCLTHPDHGYYISRDRWDARAISRPRPK